MQLRKLDFLTLPTTEVGGFLAQPVNLLEGVAPLKQRLVCLQA
jgi:hypothetical protein